LTAISPRVCDVGVAAFGTGARWQYCWWAIEVWPGIWIGAALANLTVAIRRGCLDMIGSATRSRRWAAAGAHSTFHRHSPPLRTRRGRIQIRGDRRRRVDDCRDHWHRVDRRRWRNRLDRISDALVDVVAGRYVEESFSSPVDPSSSTGMERQVVDANTRSSWLAFAIALALAGFIAFGSVTTASGFSPLLLVLTLPLVIWRVSIRISAKWCWRLRHCPRSRSGLHRRGPRSIGVDGRSMYLLVAVACFLPALWR
jgi:hypothetical protein